MSIIIRVTTDAQGHQKVTLFVCGCCLATTETIPAEWHTARRIVAGEPIVRRILHERCGDCRDHDAFGAPCMPR